MMLLSSQKSGALVAIKSVDMAKLNKKLKDNLYGEINILKTLRHPHIVALHDCVETTAYINLIMEYCELGDLSLFIKKREKLLTNPATHDMARKYPSAPNSGLNEVVIRHFLKQLASALKFLREGNFVHRDVKPQNLLLLPSPQFRQANKAHTPILTASQDSLIPVAGLSSLPMLKLADFGFARVLPSTSLAETLCGSPLYMAPEILRYERYDAKADLWSVGTVLYEMVTGRPPFRASNHVELLRRIEAAEDTIKFPRESIVSSEMKGLIRALLKRNPVERLSFENFFAHAVVTGPIPGLVEDDVPRAERPAPAARRASSRTEEPAPPIRRQSFRRYSTDQDAPRETGSGPSSPRPLRSSPLATPTETKPNPLEEGRARLSYSPRQEPAEGLGIRRPQVHPSTSAPSRQALHTDRRPHRLSNASLTRPQGPSPTSSMAKESPLKAQLHALRNKPVDEREKAAMDVAFERDYVVVEKKHVEVNAFADELAAYPNLMEQRQAMTPKSGQMVRRATQQGNPTSTTGAVASPPSRAVQIAQGRPDHFRHGSYDKTLAVSPGSTPSAVAKVIQEASIRFFGMKNPPPFLGRGTSPPQVYSPFPLYPTPTAVAGLLGDGRPTAPLDEDSRVAQSIEGYADRSDVVYGFAEVKYKQLVPLAPSQETGLGGIAAEKLAEDDDLELTVEAVVCLSEEALVLYVKVLSLLAKAMDIASLWWSRKNRAEASGSAQVSSRSGVSPQELANRINRAVQWIRARFNEVLEKAEVVRLKLIDAQKQLPGDHPNHPSNHAELITAGDPTNDGVFLSPGMSAEKIMYDRAVEMSRAAAISEIANDDLEGCELSYRTAIRMLEAVLDNDDELTKRRSTDSKGDKPAAESEDNSAALDVEDQHTVKKSEPESSAPR
jgi:serine/threonine-protein kinase ULK2